MFTLFLLSVQINNNTIIFFFMWGVQVSLRVYRLISTSPGVNDQVSLQWLSILAITGFEPESKLLGPKLLSLDHLLHGSTVIILVFT
jgi:hypothetical protein